MTRGILALLLLATAANAQLNATFTRGEVKDSRPDRFPALSIPAGQPATPFLEPGEFEVVWTGKLVLPSRLRVAFSFEGEGNAALKVDGKDLLSREGALAGEPSATTRLNAGEHEFELRYKSKPDGAAAFRLYWEEAGFVRQTVPPSAFKTEETAEVALGHAQREGRLAFTQQNCAKCHASSAGFGVSPMPETGEIGPIVVGIGDRVNEEWLRNWIADPKALKPVTHMPTLVDASTEAGRQQISDLAAFLASSTMGSPAPPAPDPGLAQAGGVTFHELGCVACHNPPDRVGGDLDPARVPLNNVAAKFKPGMLAGFLKKPDAFHPFSGMPDFKLSDAEASSLAAFLTKASAGKETKAAAAFPAGDAVRGMAAAQALQCGVCHPGLPLSGEPAGPPLEAIFKADWAVKGCVAAADAGGRKPLMNLKETEREALVAFSKTGASSLSRDSAAEFASRQIESRRCVACHDMDGKPSLLSSTHSESMALTEHVEGLHERVDQSRPQLTFMGEMLFTSYIQAMIGGTAEPRPRPWLGMRMPAFHSHSGPLAEGLSRLHGFEPASPVKPATDPAMAEIGKTLAGAEGFGCTTCHGVGPLKATAAFEVEGINFKLVPQRLREGYYHRWMDNPPSVTPSTKMPRYAEGNTSQRGDVLGGDAKKQYDAIWQYLQSQE